MSIDRDLTRDDDPVYVSWMDSAGVFRLWTGHRDESGRIRGCELSEPVPRENLIELYEYLRVHLDEDE